MTVKRFRCPKGSTQKPPKSKKCVSKKPSKTTTRKKKPTQPKKSKFAKLMKLTKKQLEYVENDWHHAVLSHYKLKPTYDNRYNDMDLDDDEIDIIVETYGIEPPSYHRWHKRR